MKPSRKHRIKQCLKAIAAFSVALTLVLTPEVLVLAEETIEKTRQVLETQKENQAREDYLRKNAVSGNPSRSRDTMPAGRTANGGDSQTGTPTENGGTEPDAGTENNPGTKPGGSAPDSSGSQDNSGPQSAPGSANNGSANDGSPDPGSGFKEAAGSEPGDGFQDSAGTEDSRIPQDPAEAPLTLPDLPSEEPDAFEKLYGEPVEINEYGKLYHMDGDNYKLILTPDPEVYRDEDGQLKEIDNTLVEEEQTVPRGPFRKAAKVPAYTNKAGAVDIKLPQEITKDSGIHITGPDGHTLTLHPAEGTYDRPAVLQNAVRYNDVFPQTDIQYTIQGNQVKEDIILKEPGTARAFTYWFPRDTCTAKLQNNIVLIYPREEEGEPLFALSAPAMTDASGEVSQAVTLTLKEDKDRYTLTVRPEEGWLDDPARNYPVKIDPTIQIPSANLNVVTTSSEKGVYSQAAYGCAGYVDAQVTGIPKSNLGRTRMFFKLNYNFKNLIPEEAAVTSATLNTYEYSAYKSTATFACYRLKDPWSTGTITWDNSVGIGREIAGEDATRPAKKGWQRFDIRQSVNDWVNGLAPQHGLMVMAANESTRGATFYTPASNTAAQPAFKPEYKPYIEINWNYPNPVPADYPLDDTTLTLRTMVDCDLTGKLQFMGVFADGIAAPGSQVLYALSDPGKGYTAAAPAGYTKKYPNTKDFESAFPATTTRYRDKQGNWQTPVPFTDPGFNTLYHLKASAEKDGKTGKEQASAPFLIYQVKQFDTMPKIAAYYGVPLSQIVYDNRMQDMLLVENNTIFIRDPKKNADKPYNPPPLSDADKEKIDKQLMGRGLHCQFGFEPVNLNTGNFILETTDASMPAYQGTFDLPRTYNSKGAAYTSAFGRGWQFPYGESISKKRDPPLQPGRRKHPVFPRRIRRHLYLPRRVRPDPHQDQSGRKNLRIHRRQTTDLPRVRIRSHRYRPRDQAFRLLRYLKAHHRRKREPDHLYLRPELQPEVRLCCRQDLPFYLHTGRKDPDRHPAGRRGPFLYLRH